MNLDSSKRFQLDLLHFNMFITIVSVIQYDNLPGSYYKHN